MEDVKKSLQDTLTLAFAKEGVPPQNKYKVMKSIEMAESQNYKNKSPKDYLNDPEDMRTVYLLVKNKKLSANKIREKIKELLKEPDQLKFFLQSILDKKPKKEENTEATSSSGAGQFSDPLFSTTKEDLVSGVKKVIEEFKKDEKIKKVETKEATTSSSSGQYSQPAIWAKSMSKKHWKGASTKYMPGSKIVQVKKKCKTFPYCNQGDIKALKIFESESVQNAIKNVSINHGYDKNYISEIVFREIKKRQN
jgi:hypothetical protein